MTIDYKMHAFKNMEFKGIENDDRRRNKIIALGTIFSKFKSCLISEKDAHQASGSMAKKSFVDLFANISYQD